MQVFKKALSGLLSGTGVALIVCSMPVEARSYSPVPDNILQWSQLRAPVGVAYYVKVTGRADGSVWGSNPYTDDSNVATAAVHAGLVRVGESAVVKVVTTIGASSYSGSTANGVTSNNFGSFAGSLTLSADDGGDNPVLPAPSNLTAYRQMLGGVYRFKVNGTVGGTAWGTNIYTDDSALTAAAVHSGALVNSPGNVVKVVIGPAHQGFIGSTHNGVTTNNYTEHGGSYSVYSDGAAQTPLVLPGTPTYPFTGLTNMANYGTKTGLVMYLSLTGGTQGSVWGTGIYTGDSSLPTAAVHAGLLSAASVGTVKVEMLGGQESYVGSTANGVVSKNYPAYSSSFRLSAPDGQEGGKNPVVSAGQATAQVGQPFSYQIQSTNSPTRYAASGLPEGLSVNILTGVISGTPKLSGSFQVHLDVTNAVTTRQNVLQLTVQGDGVVVSDPDRVFNWAEVKYPQLFPSKAQSVSFPPFYFRHYPSNNTYLASHSNGSLMYLGPLSGNSVLDLGPLSVWLAQAAKDGY